MTDMRPGQIPKGSTISYKNRLYALHTREDIGHDRAMKYHVTREDNGQAASLYIDYAAHVSLHNDVYMIIAPSWDGWASD